MRPKRLEIEGFTAFRGRTVVEFDDTDLFALVGPTGSGKSSVIDAMIFALYGSVPRYQNANLVAPAISQGRNEARIRLDFSLGHSEYSAVRIVRRTPTGATTREARLESDGEVLAGDAKSLTEQVERILGLTLTQFTTCVVLPQGEFARFLNDRPSDRQDLLVKLLGFGLYERIRQLASSRGAEARNLITLKEEELISLAEFTKDTERDAKKALKAIEAVQARFQKDRPKLQALEKELEKDTQRVQQLETDIETLGELKTPRVVQELATKKSMRETELKKAEADEKKLKGELKELDKARTVLGDATPLVEAKQRYVDLNTTRVSDAAAKKRCETLTRELSAAERAYQSSKSALTTARALLEDANREHAAHALKNVLIAGKLCPVCEQEVRKVPRSATPKDLKKAREAAARAESAHDKEDKALREVMKKMASAERESELLANHVANLEKQLKTAPALDVVNERLAVIQKLDAQLRVARGSADAAGDAVDMARSALERVHETEERLWSAFDAIRDGCSHLSPPRRRRTLAASWTSLLEWRDEQLGQLNKQLSKERVETEKKQQQHAEMMDRHVEALKELGYALDEEQSVGDEIAQFVADARSELKEVAAKLARKDTLEKSIGVTRQQAQNAETLTQHLRADRFERWLLEAAFERLVVDASDVLRGLSSGACSGSSAESVGRFGLRELTQRMVQGDF
jgi:exonuclease SbcC